MLGCPRPSTGEVAHMLWLSKCVSKEGGGCTCVQVCGGGGEGGSWRGPLCSAHTGYQSQGAVRVPPGRERGPGISATRRRSGGEAWERGTRALLPAV